MRPAKKSILLQRKQTYAFSFLWKYVTLLLNNYVLWLTNRNNWQKTGLYLNGFGYRRRQKLSKWNIDKGVTKDLNIITDCLQIFTTINKGWLIFKWITVHIASCWEISQYKFKIQTRKSTWLKIMFIAYKYLQITY